MAASAREQRAWVRGAQRGSVSDLETLFRLHWPEAYRAAYLVAQDRLSAQEVAQEGFLAAVRVIDRFGRDRPFGPWLYRTIVTRSIDAARGRVARRGPTREALLHVPDPLGWSQPVIDPLAEDEALGIAHGLSFLSPEQRAGIVLRYQFEYAPREVADILDLSRSTVNARLRRDRDHLEARLSPGGPVTARDLQAFLLSIPLPDERVAEERAWEVVRAAFAAREPTGRRHRVAWRWLLASVAVMLVAAGLAIALTPARDTVLDWVGDRTGGETGPATTEAAPAPVQTGTPLPLPGSVLAALGGEIWALDEEGIRHDLGSYQGASWSPDATYVTGWSAEGIDALDPSGRGGVQWSVTGRAATDAVWSASGFHVAYRSGAALRVVAANGTGDRRLARPVAPVEPAWRPGEAELVAYADPQGRVVVTDPETGEPEWRTGAGAPVVALAWAARGDRLAVLGESRIRLFDVPATLRVTLALPDDTEGAGLAARPGGRDFAYAAFSPRSGRTSVYLLDGRTGASRLLFAGAGRFRELVWSPDGRHLLLGWAAADEWLFVPASREGQVEVVASAGQVLGGGTGFPEPLGWCCTEG